MHEAIFGDVATAEDPYARLFAETALPPLRSAVVNQWDPRDPEPLLRCLEAFNHVLPPAARVALLVRLMLRHARLVASLTQHVALLRTRVYCPSSWPPWTPGIRARSQFRFTPGYTRGCRS